MLFSYFTLMLIQVDNRLLPLSGRRSGLMVSVVDSRSSSLGSSPGWGQVLFCVLGQDTLLS